MIVIGKGGPGRKLSPETWQALEMRFKEDKLDFARFREAVQQAQRKNGWDETDAVETLLAHQAAWNPSDRAPGWSQIRDMVGADRRGEKPQGPVPTKTEEEVRREAARDYEERMREQMEKRNAEDRTRTVREVNESLLQMAAEEIAKKHGCTVAEGYAQALQTEDGRKWYAETTGPYRDFTIAAFEAEIAAKRTMQKRVQAGELAEQIVEKRAKELWLAGKYPTIEQAKAACWTNDLYQQHRRETE